MDGNRQPFRPIRLLISVLVTEGAGGIGSLFTYDSIPNWYASLTRTPISPPNWLFAPMWITLFLLMALALYFIWNAQAEPGRKWLPVTLFSVQLFLNVLWSVLFFGLHNILFGAIEIVFLWYFILATAIEFWRLDRKSGYLLFPYLAWVTVATLLNVSVLWVNA